MLSNWQAEDHRKRGTLCHKSDQISPEPAL